MSLLFHALPDMNVILNFLEGWKPLTKKTNK